MPDLVITKKSFSKPMSDAWAADWDHVHKACDAHLQAEVLRCQEQQRLKQQVRICFWDKDASLWGQEDIDTTIVLAPDQVLLVWCSVSKVLRLAGQLSVSHLGMSSPVRPPSVPQSSMSSSSNSGLSSPILSRSSTPPSSPVPSPSPDCLPNVKAEPEDFDPLPSRVNMEDPDSLWKAGRVLVPVDFGTWPSGMYAQDMAWAFGAVGGHQDGIKAHFKKIFQPIPYVKATWYKQLQT
ncbi:hypothetical protein L208DRAFT_1377221 [Tricholoma matsutake]|nr:hypothetical protein L208DRAFT_1377221 [Tricholoma matsutake 945]